MSRFITVQKIRASELEVGDVVLVDVAAGQPRVWAPVVAMFVGDEGADLLADVVGEVNTGYARKKISNTGVANLVTLAVIAGVEDCFSVVVQVNAHADRFNSSHNWHVLPALGLVDVQVRVADAA